MHKERGLSDGRDTQKEAQKSGGDRKVEGLRPASPATEGEVRRAVAGVVSRYNNVRIHGAIGYVTPRDKLEGREREIFRERDRKLEEARARRAEARARARASTCACAEQAVPAR